MSEETMDEPSNRLSIPRATQKLFDEAGWKREKVSSGAKWHSGSKGKEAEAEDSSEIGDIAGALKTPSKDAAGNRIGMFSTGRQHARRVQEDEYEVGLLQQSFSTDPKTGGGRARAASVMCPMSKSTQLQLAAAINGSQFDMHSNLRRSLSGEEGGDFGNIQTAQQYQLHQQHHTQQPPLGGARRRHNMNSNTKSSKFLFSRNNGKLLIAMVGLPARGKTYIAMSIKRHMAWLRFNTEIFNAGNYRRKVAGPNAAAHLFDPDNKEGKEVRQRCAELALHDALEALQNNTDIAIFDATNSTVERRNWLHEEVEKCNQRILAKRRLKQRQAAARTHGAWAHRGGGGGVGGRGGSENSDGSGSGGVSLAHLKEHAIAEHTSTGGGEAEEEVVSETDDELVVDSEDDGYSTSGGSGGGLDGSIGGSSSSAKGLSVHFGGTAFGGPHEGASAADGGGDAMTGSAAESENVSSNQSAAFTIGDGGDGGGGKDGGGDGGDGGSGGSEAREDGQTAEATGSAHSHRSGGTDVDGDGTAGARRRSTRSRRHRKRYRCLVKLVFLESKCDDEEKVWRNVKESKMNSPDYQGWSVEDAMVDFMDRIAMYKKVYTPLSEDEGHSFIRLENAGESNEKLISYSTKGYALGRIMQLLSSTNLNLRPLILSRIGETLGVSQGRLSAGYSELTANGIMYTMKIKDTIKWMREERQRELAEKRRAEQEWHQKRAEQQQQQEEEEGEEGGEGGGSPTRRESSSSMRPLRYSICSGDLDDLDSDGEGEDGLILLGKMESTRQMAEILCPEAESHGGIEIVEAGILDDLNAGLMSGMTYREFAQKFPHEFAARAANKLEYKFPHGESYLDVFRRLEPLILELIGDSSPVVIISSQPVLRVIYGYMMSKPPEECCALDIPLNCIIRLIPEGYGYAEERLYPLPVSKGSTERLQQQAAAYNPNAPLG